MSDLVIIVLLVHPPSMMIWNSRRPLKSALAGTGLLLSRIPACAQDGNVLLQPSRQALIIGNSRYSRAPLANPVNDAKGMTEALRSIGFEVTRAAISRVRSDAGGSAPVHRGSAGGGAMGLFNFAGHGMQLGWRNYLLPVELRDDGRRYWQVLAKERSEDEGLKTLAAN